MSNAAGSTSTLAFDVQTAPTSGRPQRFGASDTRRLLVNEGEWFCIALGPFLAPAQFDEEQQRMRYLVRGTEVSSDPELLEQTIKREVEAFASALVRVRQALQRLDDSVMHDAASTASGLVSMRLLLDLHLPNLHSSDSVGSVHLRDERLQITGWGLVEGLSLRQVMRNAEGPAGYIEALRDRLRERYGAARMAAHTDARPLEPHRRGHDALSPVLGAERERHELPGASARAGARGSGVGHSGIAAIDAQRSTSAAEAPRLYTHGGHVLATQPRSNWRNWIWIGGQMLVVGLLLGAIGGYFIGPSGTAPAPPPSLRWTDQPVEWGMTLSQRDERNPRYRVLQLTPVEVPPAVHGTSSPPGDWYVAFSPHGVDDDNARRATSDLILGDHPKDKAYTEATGTIRAALQSTERRQ